MSEVNVKRQSRRAFMKMSALAGVVSVGQVIASNTNEVLKQAGKQELGQAYPGSKKIKTICTHCSVGCGIIAEVKDGIWVRQDVAQDHPISQGGHCCKGADMIDRSRSETRLRYPIEKVNGEWKRTSWEESMKKIGSQLKDIREKYGPDSVMFIGSAKVSNEQSYYIRKFAAFFGTNNIDHQARI